MPAGVLKGSVEAVAQRFKTAISISELGSASSQALAANVLGDSYNRFLLDAGGKITWGGGASAGDTNLYRASVGLLKSDDGFTAASLAVNGQFTLPTSDGTINQILKTDGAGVVSWTDLTGTVFVSDTEPVSANEGDFWFESDTGDIFIYYDGVWVDVGGSSVANIALSDTSPTDPGNGDLWFDTTSARTYVYYNDGSSSQWIEIGAVSAAAYGDEGYIQYYDGGTFGGASALVWSAASASLEVDGDVNVTGTVQADGGVITLTSSGAPSVSIADGALAVDTSNDVLYFRSGSTWQQVSVGVTLGTDTTGDYVESLLAGTGITITNNSGEGATPTIAIGQAVGTSDNVTFNDVTVSGNLTVSGSTTTVNTATLSVEDPLIVLASGNDSTDVVDIGFYGLYDTTGSQDLYAGLFRDATDGKFKLFKGSQTVPTTTVDTGATGYSVADLVANVEGDLTGNASSADVLSTARTLSLSGDVVGSVSFDGSADVSITTTIQADSVALGTDTTGDFVASLVAGTGVTLSNNTGESATPTVAIGQAVETNSDVTFNTVTGTNGVVTLTSSGAPTATIADGAIAVDTTNDVIYVRSGGAWVEASGGASVTVSDTAPTGAEEGDLWYKSDVGTTLVYYDSTWVEITGSGSSSAYKLTSSSRDAAILMMEIGP